MKSNHHQSTGTNDKCPECNGIGYIFIKNDKGADIGRECECQEKRKQQILYKNAAIPDQYENYNFKNFEIREDVHAFMQTKMAEYLKTFPEKKPPPPAFMKLGDKHSIKGPSFGFIATYGEERIKAINDPRAKREALKQHNNFGIGKSHLTIAAAKYLIKCGYRVQVIEDVTFLDDLMQAKMANDKGESYNNLLSLITEYADFVIWDDLGKKSWTKSREDVYYRIFNDLYKLNKPVIFSSNEDRETLADKIGHAAASRLLKGMCNGFLYPVEGKDQR